MLFFNLISNFLVVVVMFVSFLYIVVVCVIVGYDSVKVVMIRIVCCFFLV